MRTLKVPTEETDKFYRLCISKVRKKELKKELEACEIHVVNAAEEYEEKVTAHKLHTIIPESNFNGKVSIKQMNDVYTKRMVPKKSPGRPLYDKLLNAPAQGICPLCGQRVATTLDHHLPKAVYPALSVVPINLVPACKDCNTIKLNDIPLSDEDETIHPYFDNIEDEKWLFADVLKINPVVLKFVVRPPYENSLLSKRIENHFKMFDLGPLYSKHAAVELKNIRYFLTELFEKAGSKDVKEFLKTFAISREKEHINSWQSAMYRALAEDEWFHTEGVLFI